MVHDQSTNKEKHSVGCVLLAKLLIGLAFSPLIIGLMFSIHSDRELSQLPLRLFPKVPTLENYKVFTDIPIFHYLKNYHRPCGGHVSQIVFGSLAAYGFVLFKFPMKNSYGRSSKHDDDSWRGGDHHQL